MENKERMQIIATNITNYRKAKGITQKELAEAIGISQSTLTEYMKLRTAPSFGVIQKLADYFGVKKSDIDSTFKPKQSTEDIIISELVNIFKNLDSASQNNVLNFARFELSQAEQVAKSKENQNTAS